MKFLVATTASIALYASVTLAETTPMITVTPPGTRPSTAGSAENFTGSVRIESRFQGTAPASIGGGTVTFEPGARTAWHAHPLGQTLIVTAGVGLVQAWNGTVQEIRPGDTVWIPPGIKHWHGATATNSMSHIAFSESLDGQSVVWMEKVTDDQYRQ